MVGGHSLRPFFDRLADRFLDVTVLTLADLSQVRHDYRDEPAVFLEHPDLADGGVGFVGSLDLLGLDVLATL
ncbi:MAG: hypothetical protein M3118_07155, partial [Actinomycetota bacterium]|nr:hypothetical protein [Actinomycetota bacterium]